MRVCQCSIGPIDGRCCAERMRPVAPLTINWPMHTDNPVTAADLLKQMLGMAEELRELRREIVRMKET